MRSSTIIPTVTTLLLLGYIAVITYVLLFVNLSYDSENKPSFEDCGSHSCGNSIIQFPLGRCGHLPYHCSDNQTYLDFESIYYTSFPGRVIGDITTSSYLTRTLQIAPYQINPFLNGRVETKDISDPYNWLSWGGFFSVSKEYIVGTIFNCTEEKDFLQVLQLLRSYKVVDCSETNSHCIFYPATGHKFDNCTSYTIIIPANNTYNVSADKNFKQLLQKGFQITWSNPEDCHSCLHSGGRCYYDLDYARNSCVCADDEVHKLNCAGSIYKGEFPLALVAVIFFIHCAAFTIVVVTCILYHRGCCCKRTASDEEQTILEFMDPLDSRAPSVENFLNFYSSQVPTRYSYTQIRANTNNLAEQLGKGGFGTVYKGKLPSGRMIAVKILDESKQSEQQFIAEVATVGSTYHVNLVRMLGYCSEGSKRALVYEYMVNGSLEQYIHGSHPDQLDWKQLYSIAIGTARGISYLHEECRNRIIHCDIKPHNVLLDSNFLPKVGDFGLAKISKREESHISAAHGGTLGYAAPEMWSRMYGPVTDKCDVYSYGMLIMEMVGGRKNMDLDNIQSRSSKFFYAEWAFQQVEKGEYGNLRDEYISEEDQSIAKKLSLVGLWCIQFHASRRPRMSKVIQMLEGDDEITTPPYPFPVDTPPNNQLSCSDQSSPSDHCSSSYALEAQMRDPKSTVDTPPIVQLSSLGQTSSGNQSSSSYAFEVEMIDSKITWTANPSFHQSSSSYAFEVEMIDSEIAWTANPSFQVR